MHIRKMENKDLERVNCICMSAFMRSVAPSLSSEGVETFRAIASEDEFSKRSHGDNLILVSEVNGEIQGVIELKEGRHVAMLFVDPEFQNRGVGGKLLAAVKAYSRVKTITVSASLNSVPAYLQFGFVCVGKPAEQSGLKYQPMEFELN